MQFIAQIKTITVKSCADLSKTTRIEFETNQAIAGALENVEADQLVIVKIELYGDN